jgi:heme/copper-type cytochrome/quinol oxidase subunit 2
MYSYSIGTRYFSNYLNFISNNILNNDNFIIDDESIFLNKIKPYRLLETDYRLILQKNRKIQLFITSDDVIHS